MANYKLVNYKGTTTLANIRLKGDATTPSVLIPLDTENADYREYLEWVDAGNTPEAAD
jgi:hypothetical protein